MRSRWIVAALIFASASLSVGCDWILGIHTLGDDERDAGDAGDATTEDAGLILVYWRPDAADAAGDADADAAVDADAHVDARPSECRSGTYVCQDAGGACEQAPLPNGSPCALDAGDAGGVCYEGACVACDVGGDCSAPGSCARRVYDCSSGKAVCVDAGPERDGTSCDAGMYCSSGVCTACSVDAGCTPANPCHTGTVTACSGGQATCTDTTAAVANGTACGTNAVCNGGACSPCTANVACATANPCRVGTTSCASGVSSCVETGNVPDGQSCSALYSGGVCASGACVCPSGTRLCGSACTVVPTCASLHLSCGTVSDGCGGTLDCGSCGAGTTCGGGGTPGQCGCAATACQDANGCPGTADCSNGAFVCRVPTTAGAACQDANGCPGTVTCSAGKTACSVPLAAGAVCNVNGSNVGACAGGGTISCSAGTTKCVPVNGYIGQSDPQFSAAPNGSWDWNCDGCTGGSTGTCPSEATYPTPLPTCSNFSCDSTCSGSCSSFDAPQLACGERTTATTNSCLLTGICEVNGHSYMAIQGCY